MTTFHKILGQGVAVALLLLGGTTGVYGQVPVGGLGSFGGDSAEPRSSRVRWSVWGVA